MNALVIRHRLAEMAALLGEPARAGIVLALMDGSSRPAGELATLAGVAPATQSAHLRRLVEGGLLAVQAQGRHRYFRLANDDVAQLVETLALHASPLRSASAPSAVDVDLRRARTCYKHLAGALGVALFERLQRRRALRLDSGALRLTSHGSRWLKEIGLFETTEDVAALSGRSCIDWTERRYHLAGRLGNYLAKCLIEQGWLRRQRDSRALLPAFAHREGLRELGFDDPCSVRDGELKRGHSAGENPSLHCARSQDRPIDPRARVR